MMNLEQSFEPRFGLQLCPNSFLIRLGSREIFVCRDFRSRPYRVHPIIDCSAGVQMGHVEVLIFRRFLLIFSKARW
jgi:hypothetical protein